MDTTTTTEDHGMSEEWQEFAAHLRRLLQMLGVEVAICEPGEPDWCGENYATHCVSYLTALKARCEFALEDLLGLDPRGWDLAHQQLDQWRETFGVTTASRS